MKASSRWPRTVLATVAFLSLGCGIEEILLGTIIDEPVIVPPPGSAQIVGALEGNPLTVDVRFYTALGQTVEPFQIDIDRQSNPATFYAFLSGDQSLYNLRVVSSSDGVTRKAIVADPAASETIDISTIDAVSTAIALALEVKAPFAGDGGEADSATPTEQLDGSAWFEAKVVEDTPTESETEVEVNAASNGEGSSLTTHPCDGVQNFQDILLGQIATGSGPAAALVSALNAQFEAGETSYPEVVSDASQLDDELAELAVLASESASTNAELDDTNIRVMMGVVFQQGYLDSKCYELDIFKWVNPDDGDSMYLVGGIHEDSPIQDPTIQNEVFPNWIPNTLPMYNDGTHGDEVAGDNIWTLSMVLPRTLRFGYKYTFGAQGEGWTGTEEWPGNQRILEVVDVNEDGYVARFDIFADERSNKDVSNLYVVGGTKVSWDTDLNGDGYLEAREQPADFIGGDCVSDGWWVPSTLPPLTINGCE